MKIPIVKGGKNMSNIKLVMGAIFCAFLMLAIPISQASEPGMPVPIKEPELPDIMPVDYNQQIIDYAQALPTSAFLNNGLRRQMLNQLDQIQDDLEANDYSSALKTIKNHLIPNIDFWIVDDAVEAELMEMEETLIALIIQQIPATPQSFEIVDEGKISGYRYSLELYEGVQNYEVIKNQVDWEQFWAIHTTELSPVPAVPVIDFSTKMVVINMLGTHRVWNYYIGVTDVSTVDDYTLVTVERIGPGDLVYNTVSNVFSIVVVDTTNQPVMILDSWTNNIIDVIE
jgi:hypothetical protein